LESLPGVYKPPLGALWIACEGEKALGTIGIRPLRVGACEAKRLYVRPEYRRAGVGKALLLYATQWAHSKGYAELFGDTLAQLSESRNLYASIGFQEIDPFSDSPIPNAIYLRLLLRDVK
jgi:putative acetyltransferase